MAQFLLYALVDPSPRVKADMNIADWNLKINRQYIFCFSTGNLNAQLKLITPSDWSWLARGVALVFSALLEIILNNTNARFYRLHVYTLALWLDVAAYSVILELLGTIDGSNAAVATRSAIIIIADKLTGRDGNNPLHWHDVSRLRRYIR